MCPYYEPIRPVLHELREVVFPSNSVAEVEDMDKWDKMKAVFRHGIEEPASEMT